jgi:Tol biopolymer transport system component
MNKIGRSAKQLSGLMVVLAMLAGGVMPPGWAQDRKVKPSASQTKDLTAEIHEEPQGKIAFASDRTGNFEIYVMNPDGGGIVQVTDNPAEDLNPTWSPDGERLAFVSNRDGNKEIYTVDAGGGIPTRLTNNAAEDLNPAWSPSFTTPSISFVTHRDGNDEVYVMNVDGTGQTNLTNNPADDNGQAWAPSGTLLSFASNRDGDKYEIYRMTSTGTNQTRLTTNAFNDVSTTWASGRITFQSDRDLNDEIYTMNVDDTNQTRITDNPAFDLDPSRAPDGAVIAFVSNRDAVDNLEIYAVNADGSRVVRLTNHPASDVDPAVQPLPAAGALGTIQLNAASFSVGEGSGGVEITITRTDGTGSAVVDFTTNSGTASDRSDFAPIFRTLTFAPGETSKTVRILIIDDATVEGDETLSISLSGAVGSTLGSPSTAVVTISDNDTANSLSNPIDEVPFFVRQQYLDFLNREPDQAGLNFWINELNTQISNCPSTPGQARNDCILGARATVSIAFFLSIEFQESGYLVIRVYQEAFGRLPTLREFLFDVQNLTQGVIIGQPGALDQLAQNRQAFLDAFVNREEFQSRYAGVSNSAFVNALFTNAGVDPNTEAATRDAILAGLNNGTVTRQSALVQVGNTRSVFNALYNRAFVLMQYFGYLRRNPSDPPDSDLSGFNFWVTVLNNASLPSEDMRDPVQALARIRRARIVEAFITSTEYRARFGPS